MFVLGRLAGCVAGLPSNGGGSAWLRASSPPVVCCGTSVCSMADNEDAGAFLLRVVGLLCILDGACSVDDEGAGGAVGAVEAVEAVGA